MKFNILLGSLVMGLAMCSQSFGFELLDNLLGINGGGSCCESGHAAKSCCEAAKEPTCCAVEPTCAAAEPACGCEAAPSCCKPKCRKPLFNFSHCHSRKCAPACDSCNTCAKAEPTCAAVEPTCGAEPACGCEAAPCCKKKCRRSLHDVLNSIFACKKRCCTSTACNSCGCGSVEPSCGYDAGGKSVPAPAIEGSDAPPMPPAPVVDPSAFIPSQRRVVHASNGSLR